MSYPELPEKLTRDMIFNLRYDDASEPGTPSICDDFTHWDRPCCLIVFDNADIHNTAYLIAKSAQMPFAPYTIASVFVQASISEQFIALVSAQLKPLDESVTQHLGYKQTLEVIKRLNATTITANEDVIPVESSPILVCKYPQNYFGYGPSGVITYHTFETAQELTGLCASEAIPFESVSIWIENFGIAYELAMHLMPSIFYFNCYNISVEPIRRCYCESKNHVTIDENYHYESMMLEHKKMIIVFPVGTIFGN